jgi:Reverse transcriptase (RNA-dependent DNA polymerase)
MIKRKKIRSYKWIYKIKYNCDSSIKRYNTRLIAKEFTQTYGNDYQKIFVSVVKNTIRILLSVATNLGWTLFQMDVKNTFFQETFDEEIFMTLPFSHKSASNSSLACKLRKTIYGLK